jgi:DNA mismatch endonuclease (patch repair protein)
LVDIFSKKKRSQIMAKVKNKNTKPEVRVRKALFKNGFRYRINDKSLPGSPDIVLPKHRTVIFVHGCFWHGHTNCKKAITPKSNIDFWKTKILGNKNRDQKNEYELGKQDWKIVTVWDCELRNIKSFELTIDKLIQEIANFKV